jgi:hypothetical protein
MNRPNPNGKQHTSGRRRRQGSNKGADIWRDAGPLPDAEPVHGSDDPTALIRSLGEPPLVRGGEVAIHFATVIERTAVLAAALSANILTTPDPD